VNVALGPVGIVNLVMVIFLGWSNAIHEGCPTQTPPYGVPQGTRLTF
jgi:hypothetical protein